MTVGPTLAPAMDWAAWYRERRVSTPVWYDEQRRLWNVFRYADVQQVLTDYATFSSQLDQGAEPSQQREHALPNLIFSDPPIHRKLRALVTQAFSAQAVAALEPRIATIATMLLDQVVSTGRLDVIDDLAGLLPVLVIAELLGVPPADHARLKRWSDAMIALMGTNIDQLASGAAGDRPEFTEMSMYLISLIEQRRRRPRQDLISSLLAARVDDHALTRFELMSFCSLLLVAGTETTTHLIGNSVWSLIEQPGAWASVRADPSLLPGTIEEVLRYRPPLRGVFRLTTRATTIAGQEIPAHSRIFAWLASANRDEAQFSDPDRFDITRLPNRHLSFGHSIHFCLGALLSRLETRVVLELMLRRFADVRLAADQPLEPLANIAMQGVQHLPVTFRLAS